MLVMVTWGLMLIAVLNFFVFQVGHDGSDYAGDDAGCVRAARRDANQPIA